jgi:hypothetical protein
MLRNKMENKLMCHEGKKKRKKRIDYRRYIRALFSTHLVSIEKS